MASCVTLNLFLIFLPVSHLKERETWGKSNRQKEWESKQIKMEGKEWEMGEKTWRKKRKSKMGAEIGYGCTLYF